MLTQDYINRNIVPPDSGAESIIKKKTDDATEQAIIKDWTDIDPIPTSESQKITPLDPQEAKEQGMIGKIIDGTSDAVMGLYAGVGYGIDELAVSATQLLNYGGEKTGWYDSPEYEAKYITNYMDQLEQRGIAGEVARSIGQFMIGWMPWTRGIGYMAKGMQAMQGTKKAGEFLGGATRAGKISSNFLASTLTGGTAFSPNHENLANMLQGLDGYTKGAVSEFFATNPNDPDWKNRLRNALQEGGFSLLGDTVLVPAVKGIARGMKGLAGDPLDKLVDQLAVLAHTNANKVKQKYDILGRGKTDISIADGKTKFGISEATRELDQLDKGLTVPRNKGETASDYITRMDKDGSLDAKFAEARTLEEKGVLAENIAKQLSKDKDMALGTVEVNNVKWKKGKDGAFRTTVNDQKWSIRFRKKDKQWVLRQGKEKYSLHPSLVHAKQIMAEEANVALKKAIPRRTNEQLMKEGQRLFDEVGLDAETVRNLPTDMAWNDTQLYAFGKLIQNTQKEMMGALKLHGSTATNHADHKMLEGRALSAIANHADALTFLNGAKKATARAMASLRGVKKMMNQTIHADHINSSEIAQVIKSSNLGGHDISRMTQMILHAYETNGSKMGAKALIEGVGENEGGFWNQFVEAWINQGLLSNPATHALNTFSGLTNIAGHVGSQITSAFISKLPFVENKILFREAFGSVYGLMAGLTKAFRLSARATLTNQQVVTKGVKIENYGFKHLAAKHVGKGIGGAEDTAIGLGVDLMGSLNRIPGRFLLMEDEFVKSISYDMMLHSKAWKYAWSAQGKNNKGWMTSRSVYRDIVENPKLFSDEMGDLHHQAQDLANLVTFQRDVGSTVNRLSGVMQSHPYLKLFVPFLKVLTNIPKYVVQHSPLGLVARNDQFKQGGSARMLEMGRMAYGTMLMMYGGHLYNTGNLRATGSRNFHEKMNKQNMGLDQEMSIKLKRFNGGEDTFVEIGRIAPIVNLLGLGADMAKGVNMHDQDPDQTTELVWQGVSSMQKNLISGTWAPNLHKLLGVLADDRMEPKDWSRAVLSIVGTMQPAYVRAYEKLKHPERSNIQPFGMNSEDIGTSTDKDWSKVRAKFESVSSHSLDSKANIYPKRNAIGDVIRSHDETKGIPEILNNPLVSFLTFRKANDNPVLKHIFGGTDDKIQSGKVEGAIKGQGKDLELPIKPLNGKIKIAGQAYKMTPEELDFYQGVIGKVKSDAGQTLEQAWASSFRSDFYKELPRHADGVNNDRRDVMMNIYNHYKERAKGLTIVKFGLEEKAQAVRTKFKDKTDDQIIKRNNP